MIAVEVVGILVWYVKCGRVILNDLRVLLADALCMYVRGESYLSYICHFLALPCCVDVVLFLQASKTVTQEVKRI